MDQKLELVDYSNQVLWDTVLLVFVLPMCLYFDFLQFVIDLVQ